jgi:glycosyltransferase involved in cell wall biosynthesis
VILYLLDGRSLQDGSATRGIGTYLRGLLAGFQTAAAAHDVGLLIERGAAPPEVVSGDGFAVHPVRLRQLNRHLRPLLDPLQIGRALRTAPPSLYHAIEYGQPISAGVPVVVTVHDLVPFVMPTEYPWMRRERALAMRQFRRADAVIAVSQSTARDVQRIAGVDLERITVIPEGVHAPPRLEPARLDEIAARLRVPRRFVLAVGTFDPRKRIDVLTDVVRRLRAHHDVGLVIAGSQGNFATAVQTSVARAGLGSVTHVLGHVSNEELAALYQTTDCLLFTSAYEGFGLPPLEAMAAGAPVAVFDNSSLPEVVGDVGLVVKDGDAAAMADAVGALLADGSEVERRAAMGRARAGGFGWDRAAQATLAVYNALLDG